MSVPAGFDELIHPATRLSVVALLAATEWADFAFVRDSLSLSVSALSKQLHTLEEAGYLELHKVGGGRKRRTRVRLTGRGRTAFEGHVAALRAIVEGAPRPRPKHHHNSDTSRARDDDAEAHSRGA
ncbi:transcriptional regulator [Streptomyces sp. NPDC097640]|uniref:transcriptional regulator n=1 Tax=Streptomyces sp. NPDC097640 TaxID=3157229 RepID=UPI0033204D19